MKERFKFFFEQQDRPKVLVIGDLILDEYIWGGINRISPEAPVPILETRSETLALGGAANVANNLVALGCEVHLCGAIGQDEKGDKLLQTIHNRSMFTFVEPSARTKKAISFCKPFITVPFRLREYFALCIDLPLLKCVSLRTTNRFFE